MNREILSPELPHNMDTYLRAANYLSVWQIYLCDNPLLKRPLTLADVKHMVLGTLRHYPDRISSTSPRAIRKLTWNVRRIVTRVDRAKSDPRPSITIASSEAPQSNPRTRPRELRAGTT